MPRTCSVMNFTESSASGTFSSFSRFIHVLVMCLTFCESRFLWTPVLYLWSCTFKLHFCNLVQVFVTWVNWYPYSAVSTLLKDMQSWMTWNEMIHKLTLSEMRKVWWRLGWKNIKIQWAPRHWKRLQINSTKLNGLINASWRFYASWQREKGLSLDEVEEFFNLYTVAMLDFHSFSGSLRASVSGKLERISQEQISFDFPCK